MKIIKKWILRLNFAYMIKHKEKKLYKKLAKSYPRLKNFDLKAMSKIYKLFSDGYSKKIFVRTILNRVIGGRYKCGLPQDKYDWQKELEKIEKTAVCQEVIDKEVLNGDYLIKYQLINYTLTINNDKLNLFTCAEAIFLNFKDCLNQYGYKNVEIAEGDYVIDGGGCIGDTALFFAASAGKTGKVFSFEFGPDNVSTFSRNLALNPDIASRITLVQSALWSNSQENLFVLNNGPASCCSISEFPGYTMKINTVSIDDFVKNNKIEKIDFIKMDIEGAEVSGLEGAKETILKFRPKLAICVYHRDSDFTSIPDYIKKLVPEYKLYLNHYMQGEWETVLYAICDK